VQQKSNLTSARGAQCIQFNRTELKLVGLRERTYRIASSYCSF